MQKEKLIILSSVFSEYLKLEYIDIREIPPWTIISLENNIIPPMRVVTMLVTTNVLSKKQLQFSSSLSNTI